MSKEELQHEIDDGVVFWGYEEYGFISYNKKIAFECLGRFELK